MAIDKKLTKKFLLFLSAYCLLQLALRLFVSDSLEWDEAEMVLLSQQGFQLGYHSQPPLYDWLQLLFFKVFGLNIVSLALLKNILIFVIYFYLYKAARLVLKDELRSLFCCLSLLLVYDFSWLLQKDLTHSISLMAVCAMTLYFFLRMLSANTTRHYLFLGICIGLGVLAKYNYLFFILPLFLSASVIPEYRSRIFTKRIFLSLIVFLVLVLPHLFWVAGHKPQVTSGAYKFVMADSHSLLAWRKGLLSFVTGAVLFLLSPFVFYLFFFPGGFKRCRLRSEEDRNNKRFFEVFFLSAFALIIAAIFIFNVRHIEQRWFQPVLFVFPFYFFIRMKDRQITPIRSKLFLALILVCAAVITFSIPGRVVFASVTQKYTKLNYPWSDLSARIREEGFEKGLIIAKSQLIGGNLKLNFRDPLVLIADKTIDPDV